MDEWEEEEYEQDARVEEAKDAVLKEIEKQRVVTDREIKVRLEARYFPWVTGRAMMQMIDSHQVRKHGYAGRRKTGGGITASYYSLYETEYDDIKEIIRQKREVSAAVVSILTGEAAAGAHAEDLFDEALVTLGFTVHGRDMSEWNGRKLRGEEGKEPPNLDFIIERDGVVYGLDVKNWIRFEADTRDEVKRKVQYALELGIQPFIAARYVDQDTIYTVINGKGGIAYRFVRLLVPVSFDSLAARARDLLGYPVAAIDRLPDYSLKWIEKLHTDNLRRRGM